MFTPQSIYFLLLVSHSLPAHCRYPALLPAKRWQLWDKSFQGVAEEPKGGAQVAQIERFLWNVWNSSAALLLQWIQPPPSAPRQLWIFCLPPGTPPPTPPPHPNPPLHPLMLSALRVEPARSCQSASLFQPNYHTYLKDGKSSSALPGVAFPLPA